MKISSFFTNVLASEISFRVKVFKFDLSHKGREAYLNEFTFRFNRRFYPLNAILGF